MVEYIAACDGGVEWSRVVMVEYMVAMVESSCVGGVELSQM